MPLLANFGLSRTFRFSLLLLLGVPLSVFLRATGGAPLWVFLSTGLAMVPLAGLLGKATEQLAERSGPVLGGLLNATFGNAAELIIGVIALREGLTNLVKASITGSILGNLLLILGLSFVAGGLRTRIIRFSRTGAGMATAMLALAVAGLVFPALFHRLHPGTEGATLGPSALRLTEAVAIILIVTYAASLWFSLRTHRDVFAVGRRHQEKTRETTRVWSGGLSVGILGAATALVALESELLVGAIEPVTRQLGLSQLFLGLVIIPLVGNAAEHAAAVTVARNGNTPLAFQIALGSSTQVALLVAPLLIFAGLLLGQPISLVFTPLEIISLAIATAVMAIITLDGESHWFEGVQLLALYGMIVAAAYVIR